MIENTEALEKDVVKPETSVLEKDHPTTEKKEPALNSEQLKELAANRHNIFMEEKILNPALGNLIADTLIAGPMDRFDIMNEFKEKASSLPEKKKLLANNIYDAFIEACCVGSPSKRLLHHLEKKPNLLKLIKPNRINRNYETIDMVSYRLKLDHLVGGSYVPLFTTMMMMSFSYPNIKDELDETKQSGIRNRRGSLLAALLASYTRCLNPYDYKAMWFVVAFLKNLSVCSLIQPDQLKSMPDLADNAKNLFMILDKLAEMYPIEKDGSLGNTNFASPIGSIPHYVDGPEV